MDSRIVSGGADLVIVRDLFREYSEQVGVDLCFQGFASELAGLPGDYAAPVGTLILGLEGEAAAGCVAVRRWDASACEMKRLYVRPAHQGAGVGRYLAEQAIVWAASQRLPPRFSRHSAIDAARPAHVRAPRVPRYRRLSSKPCAGRSLHVAGYLRPDDHVVPPAASACYYEPNVPVDTQRHEDRERSRWHAGRGGSADTRRGENTAAAGGAFTDACSLPTHAGRAAGVASWLRARGTDSTRSAVTTHRACDRRPSVSFAIFAASRSTHMACRDQVTKRSSCSSRHRGTSCQGS